MCTCHKPAGLGASLPQSEGRCLFPPGSFKLSQSETTHLLGIGCGLEGTARKDLLLSSPKGSSRDGVKSCWGIYMRLNSRVRWINWTVTPRLKNKGPVRIKIPNPLLETNSFRFPAAKLAPVLARAPLPPEVPCFLLGMGPCWLRKETSLFPHSKGRRLQASCGSFRCSLG